MTECTKIKKVKTALAFTFFILFFDEKSTLYGAPHPKR